MIYHLGESLDETEDLTDILSHQQEINRLNADLERTRAECLHWKRESKRNSTPQQVGAGLTYNRPTMLTFVFISLSFTLDCST